MAVEHVVVLNGLPESGKDTFASFVAKHWKGKTVVHSTVATVKLMALDWFGVEIEEDKNQRKRRLWSDLDDAWMRYCDGPVNEVVELVDRLNWNGNNGNEPTLLIVHAREPKKIEKLKKVFAEKCVTVLVKRAGVVVAGAGVSNHADRNVEKYGEYDVTINNDTEIEDLDRLAERFVNLVGVLGIRIKKFKKGRGG